MELINYFAWRYANSRDEEACFLFDDNIDELR